jgi:hypothetical protein
MHTSNKRWLLFCVAGIACCAAAGCGRRPTVSMTGVATLDGQPLPTGTIALIPLDRTGGPSVGAEIVDGRYDIPSDKGPLRGHKYRIEIRSIDPASGSTSNPLSRGLKVFLDRVPPAYNSESQLELAVPEDAADVRQDFELQSKMKRP